MTLVSREGLQAFVHELLHILVPATSGATVFALSGNLGAGKTTFTQSLARELGIQETLTSPTFVIMKTYPLILGIRSPKLAYERLIHIDAYRIEDSKEIILLGWNEMIADPKNLIVVEWPEKVHDSMPRDAINIVFEVVDENTRSIQILGIGSPKIEQ